METHPTVFIAIGDALIAGNNLTSVGFTKLQQIKRLYGGTDMFIAGCCSVFRSSWKDLYQPLPVSLESYDGWLHHVGRTLMCREVIQPLQLYRLHATNT